MGIRSGDINPGSGYLAERAGLTVDELAEANYSSGSMATRDLTSRSVRK